MGRNKFCWKQTKKKEPWKRYSQNYRIPSSNELTCSLAIEFRRRANGNLSKENPSEHAVWFLLCLTGKRPIHGARKQPPQHQEQQREKNSSYEKEHKQRGSDLVTNEVDQQRNPYHERSLVPVMQRKQQVYTRCRRLQLMVLIHFEPPQKQKVTCRNEKGGGLGWVVYRTYPFRTGYTRRWMGFVDFPPVSSREICSRYIRHSTPQYSWRSVVTVSLKVTVRRIPQNYSMRTAI